MIIMNKLYKCALWLFTAFILSFACFSKADDVEDLIVYSNNFSNVQIWTSYTSVAKLNWTHEIKSCCVKFTNYNHERLSIGFSMNPNWVPVRMFEYANNWIYVCLDYYADWYLIAYSDTPKWFDWDVFVLSDLLTTPIPKLTSIQCQTEYNLIPVEEITANYCKLNFNLIDPMECPLNQWTWTIVRSNLMINDIPYAQNQNINVFIPDFLAWNIAFNDFNTTIEVEWYNADEEYIENVINQEKLTPTNKDIEDMLTWFMTNYFPYLALAIVFLYLARKIFKLFK